MVSALDMYSGGQGLKSRSDHLGLFLGSPLFKSSATLVNSQLVSLPPVGVFKMFMFHLSYYFLSFTVSAIGTAVLNTSTLLKIKLLLSLHFICVSLRQ